MNQWKNTDIVYEWFRKIENKGEVSFLINIFYIYTYRYIYTYIHIYIYIYIYIYTHKYVNILLCHSCVFARQQMVLKMFMLYKIIYLWIIYIIIIYMIIIYIYIIYIYIYTYNK